MKLATLRNGTRDGQLVVVDRTLARAVPVPQIAPTLQAALDDWSRTAPLLEKAAAAIHSAPDAIDFDPTSCAAPLPRAYHWADGSAYVDYLGSWGPMILGHAHPAVVEAVSRAARDGTSYGAPCAAEVELAGVVVKRRTAGTYVSDSASPLARRQRLKIITERVDALLAEARQMDINIDQLIELIQERDETMQTAAASGRERSA